MNLRTWSGWPAAVSTAIATGLLLVLLAFQQGRVLPLFLVQLVVLVLVAGAAYLLDDTAKSVTDVVPRTLLRRRTTIVAQGLGVVAVGWLVMLALLSWLSPSTTPHALSWEVAGLSCIAVAVTAIVSRVGEDEPGNLVAPALALVVIGALIVQPIVEVPLLATSTGDPANSGWWALTIVVAVLTFILGSVRVCRRGDVRRPR